MSFADQTAEPAQPDEGQGVEADGGASPWEGLLSRIPDDVREDAASAFREMEGNATRKFQEHAEQRKQWEPYQQLGLPDRDPQQVAFALQVAEFAESDPAAFAKWAAENYGQQQEETPAAQEFDEFALQDPQMIEQLLEQRLEQRLSPLQQMLEQQQSRFEQQDQAYAQQEAQQFVESQMAELAEKHGDAFDKEGVELFLDHFTNTAQSAEDLRQAVPRAFEALQSLRNKHEKLAFQSKTDSPLPAEGGGVANMTPEKLSGLRGPGSAMEEAKKILQSWNSQ